MKEKNFKARNKDADFSKKIETDTVLGRQSVRDSAEPFTSSERNRPYQQKFSENTVDVPTSQNPSDSQEILKPTENNTEQQEDLENINLDRQTDIPYSPPSSEPPKKGGFSNAITTAARNKRYQRKFNQKTFDADFSKQNTEHSADSTAEETQTDNAEPVKENENYNFQESANNPDEAFDRVTGNSDFQLGADSEKDSAAGNPKQPDKNKTYQKKRVKTEKTAEYNIKEAVDAGDTIFDRVTEKEDFVFETRESKTEFSFRPADDKGTDQKTAGNKNRLYQEKQSKTESAENADTVSDISEKGDFQFKRAEKAQAKADKLKGKAEKAQNKLPHKRKLKKQRVYDEQKQKPKNRLKFEKEVKPQQDIYKRRPLRSAAGMAGMQVINKVHSKIGEAERENSAVEGAHKTEQKAERLLQFSNRTRRLISQNRKNAPYKKAARLQFKAEKADAKAFVEKTLADNPDLKKKSALKKFIQKKQIKKKYQQAKRAEQNAKQGAKQAKRAAKTAKDVTVHIVEFIKRHKKVFAVILLIALLIAWVATTISSCAIMGTTGINSIMVSSYFAEDEDIYAAENYYKDLESDLQSEINNIERDYSGYDEYNYDLAQIGHNPYELISYLSALYMDFTFNDIKQPLDDLFEQQYILTLTSQTETRTDDEGNEKEYKILNVTLVNKNITMLANTNLTDDQRELYGIYLESKGNRDYLFEDDIYSNPAVPPSYTIPGEALSDATFRRLITEAEKYLGYPYVWGGSSPSTSFDCSGFVCWVYQASGVYPLSRTTAQGIFNQCAVVSRSDAKPGDIIFFTGTYNAGEPVTHVGIYVGNGMMIHCGNPIQYASIDSSYWSSHFYAFGRLGGG